MTKVEKIDNFLMQTDKSLNYLTIAYINVVLSYILYIYIYTHGGYILSIRSDVGESTQTPPPLHTEKI
jgi:hypothetical protein